MPRIDDLLDWLVNADCLSSIDLYTGYYYIEIQQGDEYKTAFLPTYDLLEFLVLLFSLTNIPSMLLRLKNSVIHDLIDKYVLVYLDDILVYSENAT